MDWLPALLKHLSIARSAVLALLIASATIYFGSRSAPDYIPALPETWSILVVGIFVFSAALVVLWMLTAIWEVICKVCGFATTKVLALWLSDLERELLLAMANNPTKSFDIEAVNFDGANFTHIDLLEAASQLESKGLVTNNSYDDNLVRLTENGRKRANKIRRKIAKNTV